jgi:signal transduction histidine kinase
MTTYQDAPGPQFKILIVDDREENIFSLENMLEGEGRTFFKALSGNEALKIAFKEIPSLVLMDVQMPEMDGFETVEILKSNPRTDKIPVIFVTAINKDSKYVVKGLQDGAIDYLFKPLDIEVTRAKVSTILQMVHQQNELKLKNEELERLNQEKNHLLGMAAHDLRNPLGNILILSDFVLDGSKEKLTDDQQSFLAMIKQASMYMMGLINNILDVSKIESGKLELKPKLADIRNIIESNLNLNVHLASKKNIELERDLPTDDVIAMVDGSYIDQVLNNLISNAVKFSESDTKIIVRLEKSGNDCLISVIDQGPGIPEHELGRLFKFFSRTSVQTTQGEYSTGLGLAISRKIVEAHGGSISVESTRGVGSVFSFRLPID